MEIITLTLHYLLCIYWVVQRTHGDGTRRFAPVPGQSSLRDTSFRRLQRALWRRRARVSPITLRLIYHCNRTIFSGGLPQNCIHFFLSPPPFPSSRAQKFPIQHHLARPPDFRSIKRILYRGARGCTRADTCPAFRCTIIMSISTIDVRCRLARSPTMGSLFLLLPLPPPRCTFTSPPPLIPPRAPRSDVHDF